MQENKNAVVKATKNEKGYIELTLSIGSLKDVSIKVNDFGGNSKRKASRLAYAIYMNSKEAK